MKYVKLRVTPITKDVEIVEVENGIIGNRTKVNPVEALACGVIALYNEGMVKEVIFTDADDCKWSVEFKQL